ncbi:N utilization substance protein A [Breznakia sp. PF5-3]|uniref:transcription termination factor NusA n=1 Tax=unclassified Breznakia TaxID=2623764 RepID=UPI0024071E34|nr:MULTISPECIES: transcription termination factor NusA [unclassified Breznakia]MDF9824068.1 N utilization substance protein A [Breznakia sp. PM6-1]MDF9834866.1 N utilization substance protein A [Breznakia sp. PF5-3]MDF9837112.1 N utilization substance protein A [Breznakia sp. PFB2-8]MDF9859037.1 N utilization substance protein A [Breznakia sp. PH5-24]
MKLKDVMKAMQEIESDRSISKEIIIEALQEALTKAYRKHIDIQDAYVRVSFDDDIKVYHQKLVVEEVTDDELEISLEDAKAIREDYELGAFVEEEVDFTEFGRIAIILAKNVMKQKTREAQKQAVYDEYADKLEELVTGVVETVEDKFCLVNIGKTLALMPKVAQIPNETYYEGQHVKVVISDVNKETKGAQVLVSRADPVLVKRLFEKEVPEIYQGIVEIKAIAREAGERCKMAVYSNNENIDPIGACIGPRGSRVQVIIEELKGEKIDIFEWSEDVGELIKNALAPAEILAVIPNEAKRGLMVIVNDDQLSLAIGKKGKNARLAVKLTNNTIDIKSVSDAETMGIDWKAIAEQEALKMAEAKEQERARAQKDIFDELSKQEAQQEFSDELLSEEFIEEEFQPETTTPVETNKEKVVVEETVEVAKEKAQPKPKKVEKVEVPKEEDELEKAARLAKEKKAKGIDIEEKRAYVSKFEDIAGAKKEETPKAKVKKKYKKQDDNDAIYEDTQPQPTHDPNERDYELKPIYTEEELAEIAAAEAAEKEKAWINDDIDFDEYDEFYDEE